MIKGVEMEKSGEFKKDVQYVYLVDATVIMGTKIVEDAIGRLHRIGTTSPLKSGWTQV